MKMYLYLANISVVSRTHDELSTTADEAVVVARESSAALRHSLM